ncbi:hypothetical protein M0812_02786 [Anaeramoeba flamelloides]|uniref:Uncharacterized protein n=1 Tax=Anaeramoeba flamelloides TaxID=1746091 RepID=A0AAV7YT74_9EUKA|nr:hypothetical protein M0812_02786 [Anaeramoeba flamelloides]
MSVLFEQQDTNEKQIEEIKTIFVKAKKEENENENEKVQVKGRVICQVIQKENENKKRNQNKGLTLKSKSKPKLKSKTKPTAKTNKKDQNLAEFLRSKRIIRQKGHQYLTQALNTLNKPSNTNDILEQIKLLFPSLWEGYMEYFKTKKDADRSLRIFVVENPINTMKVSRKRWTKKSRPKKNFDFNQHFYFEQSIGSERRCRIGLKKWLKPNQGFLYSKTNLTNEEKIFDSDLPQKLIGTSLYSSEKERRIVSKYLIPSDHFGNKKIKKEIGLSDLCTGPKNKTKVKRKFENLNQNQITQETGTKNEMVNGNMSIGYDIKAEKDDQQNNFPSINNDLEFKLKQDRFFNSELFALRKRNFHFSLDPNERSNGWKKRNQNTLPYGLQNFRPSLVNKVQKSRRLLSQDNSKSDNVYENENKNRHDNDNGNDQDNNTKSKQIISEIIKNYSEKYENVLFELQTQKRPKLKLAEEIIGMNLPSSVLSSVLKRVGCGDKIVIMLINTYSEMRNEEKPEIINALITYVLKFL